MVARDKGVTTSNNYFNFEKVSSDKAVCVYVCVGVCVCVCGHVCVCVCSLASQTAFSSFIVGRKKNYCRPPANRRLPQTE